MLQETWRPNISNPETAAKLSPRNAPYFNLLQYCRHLGLHVRENGEAFWVGRVRRKDGGYTQKRLLRAFSAGSEVFSYEEARCAALRWFSEPSILRISSEAYQIGSKRELSICPIGKVPTVGHALEAYLEWKLLAATRSHFETLVSLCNYHLVPRVSAVALEEFSGHHFHLLAKEVLETPPKTRRTEPKGRTPIRELSDEELRKRKKTFNALVSILRGAFELTWERGMLNSDRPMRCLRRLPNTDRPRVVFLDRAECRKLLHHSHPGLRNLVAAALYTGCRANELISMQVSDFAESSSSVFVSAPKGRRSRHVFLPTEGVVFFRSLTSDRPPSDRIFVKRNGRTWGGEYKTYFQRARTDAGLPDRLTFHGLRHTYASQLLQNGASLVAVADQLGHANTQTVSQTYGHLTASRRSFEVERYFEPLNLLEPKADRRAIASKKLSSDDMPMFKHRDATSWPRSNFSRYSGLLLRELRPRG